MSTFYDWLMVCSGNSEFVENFDRLSGAALSAKRSPIDRMVDEATGKQDDDLGKFVAFCHDLWQRIPAR